MSTNFRPLRNIRKRPAALPKEKEKYKSIEHATRDRRIRALSRRQLRAIAETSSVSTKQ